MRIQSSQSAVFGNQHRKVGKTVSVEKAHGSAEGNRQGSGQHSHTNRMHYPEHEQVVTAEDATQAIPYSSKVALKGYRQMDGILRAQVVAEVFKVDIKL